MDEVSDIGIAAPGSVDPETGDVAYANNLPFLNSPVCSWMKEQLGKPCYIDNDANAAAYGELLAGAGKGASNFVMVTLGTGVGGGVIIDGKIYGGFNHAGAELGHMMIVRDGEQCTCGNKGCFEAYGSATALIRQTKEAMDKNPDSKMWELSKEKGVSGRTAFDAMRAGDEAGKKVVDEYIGYLACGLTNLVNIFQPEFIAIGGGICNEGETLLAPLREQVSKGDYNMVMPKKCAIRTAALGNDAGIIGAAGLYRLK
jgi:glucokinase